MKVLYKTIETSFEKVSFTATRVLGNSITFIIALSLVVRYFTDKKYIPSQGITLLWMLYFLITFLSIFIIQKSVNRFLPKENRPPYKFNVIKERKGAPPNKKGLKFFI